MSRRELDEACALSTISGRGDPLRPTAWARTRPASGKGCHDLSATIGSRTDAFGVLKALTGGQGDAAAFGRKLAGTAGIGAEEMMAARMTLAVDLSREEWCPGTERAKIKFLQRLRATLQVRFVSLQWITSNWLSELG